jgi:hypothetical protein
MMMDLSAILLLAAAATPRGADARERAEAYYFYSLGQQARLAGEHDQLRLRSRQPRHPDADP